MLPLAQSIASFLVSVQQKPKYFRVALNNVVINLQDLC